VIAWAIAANVVLIALLLAITVAHLVKGL